MSATKKTLLTIFAAIIIVTTFVIVMFAFFIAPKGKITVKGPFPTPTNSPGKIPETIEIPKPNIKTPPSIINGSTLGNITFSILNIFYPKKLAVFTSRHQTITQTQAEKIANNLSFNVPGKESTKKNGKVLSFIQEDKSLIFYLDIGNIQFSSDNTSTDRTVKSADEAIKIAKDFLNNFEPFNKTLAVDQKSIVYYKGGNEVVAVSSFNDADIYDIPFIESVNGITIYSQYGSAATAHVWVDRSGKVIKVTMNTPQQIIATRDENILSLNGAKTKILNGEQAVVKYGDNVNQLLPIPKNTNFSTVNLGYLKDPTNNTLYPIFVFNGTSTTGSGDQEITVYLPAIE